MTPLEGLSLWKDNIQEDLDHFDGVMPERFAIAWRAYLAGFAEWGNVTNDFEWRGITPAGYRELLSMIPRVYDDPAERIARLQDGAPRPDRFEPMSDALVADLTARLRRDIEAFGDPLPEREAIAWRAYLGALTLTHAIPSLNDLESLLPEVPDDPAIRMYGWHTDWDNLIQNDIDRFGDPLPERYAIAWRGYLTALWEWGELNRRKYHELLAMVPARNDPSGDIAREREQDHARWRMEGRRVTSDEVQRELAARIQRDIDYFVGELPERFAIAWQAYLLALYRKDILTEEAQLTLWHMTPTAPDDPVATVFFKRED